MKSKEKRSWRELCEAASNEMDSEKLMALVSELTVALDQHLGRSDGASYSNLRNGEYASCST
jgi:hypothetical protein